MITVTEIHPKPYSRFGQKFEPRETQNTYNAEIMPGESIRIFGVYRNHVNGPQEFDKIFKIGDWCEYDSYNLRYTGKIVGIGAKTIAVRPEHSRKTKRLALHTFCWRNWNFDLQKTAEYNAIESQYI